MWCFIWALAENSVLYIVSQGRQCIAACLQIRAMVSVKDLTSLRLCGLANVIQIGPMSFKIQQQNFQWTHILASGC